MRILRRYFMYRRHGFGRRAALSWARVKLSPTEQREADLEATDA